MSLENQFGHYPAAISWHGINVDVKTIAKRLGLATFTIFIYSFDWMPQLVPLIKNLHIRKSLAHRIKGAALTLSCQYGLIGSPL